MVRLIPMQTKCYAMRGTSTLLQRSSLSASMISGISSTVAESWRLYSRRASLLPKWHRQLCWTTATRPQRWNLCLHTRATDVKSGSIRRLGSLPAKPCSTKASARHCARQVTDRSHTVWGEPAASARATVVGARALELARELKAGRYVR